MKVWADLPTVPYDHDEEMIARTLDDGWPRVRVYDPPEVAVVIGRGGRQELELKTAKISADGVKLFKRPGGGCSVVLDPGNLIISVAVPFPGIGGIKSAFAGISDWLITALKSCGVPGVKQRGISDLAIGEKKIGGSCMYRTRDLVYYSTTLLLDPDLELVNRYLLHPPREPDYRAGRAHRYFMGSLRAMGLPPGDADLAYRLNIMLNLRLEELMDSLAGTLTGGHLE
jgi:lipoate-protein ligase A